MPATTAVFKLAVFFIEVKVIGVIIDVMDAIHLGGPRFEGSGQTLIICPYVVPKNLSKELGSSPPGRLEGSP